MGDMDAYKQEEGDRPVEHSPRGRYIRFDIRLGSGAYKTVYKAYDTDQGIDVAWNAIDIGVLPSSEKTRIIQEVQLLQKLEHKNIINFYGSWFSKEKNQVVFITEIMTSGTLKSYIKRVQFVKWKIIKRWCVQILEGLHYLHSQNPPVVHRDLKCDNIFINGNTGDLRIGDLGLSTQLAVHKRSKAQSVLGTPEFMAPELYDESYDEKVDIYAFGMCVLEMVTKEVPYSECINPAQIYKKVTAGIRPRGMQRIISQGARDFIELCLSRGNGQIDVSAQYLLNHEFLKPQDDDNELVQVLDEDELERDVPPPPPVPVMNARAFADQLDMESGSKGKDQTVPATERRKQNASLSMEPEELSTGSAENSAPSSGVQTVDPVAEDKSPGKHHVLVPPKTLATNDVAPAPSTLPPLPPLPPRAPVAVPVVEPVVDEPLSDKKGDQDHVDTFLSGLPPSEANIRNHRIALMGGRGQRIETPDTLYVDDNGDDKQEPPAAAPGPAAVPAAAPAAASPAPPTSDSGASPEPTPAPAPLPVAPNTERVASPVLSEPPPVAETPVERRVRTNTIDSTGRGTRPASAQRRRGKRYDIKASKDPDNSHGILLNLRIALDGRSKEIKFPFSLFTDSPHEVACELAVDVGILEPDLEDIAEAISFLVTEGKINNYSNADQDIWDEAPEPHGFPSKPLPPVSKMTFSSVPGAQALAGFPEGLQPVASGILPASQLDPSALRMSDSGLPSSISTTFATAISTPHLTHSTSDSTLFTTDDLPPSSPSYEHGISMGSMNDANFIRSVRKFEDRMMMARTAFDEREASLEEAIRTEEEKHQRELERIRKKMQQFNEKTARATMARQERMRLGTDEFRSDGETDGTALDLDV